MFEPEFIFFGLLIEFNELRINIVDIVLVRMGGHYTECTYYDIFNETPTTCSKCNVSRAIKRTCNSSCCLWCWEKLCAAKKWDPNLSYCVNMRCDQENIPNRVEINQCNFQEKLGIKYVRRENHLSVGRIAAAQQKKNEQSIAPEIEQKLPEIVPNLIQISGPSMPASPSQMPELAQGKPDCEEPGQPDCEEPGQPESPNPEEYWSVTISDDEPFSDREDDEVKKRKEMDPPEKIIPGKTEVEPGICAPPRKLLSIKSGKFNIQVQLLANGEKNIVII